MTPTTRNAHSFYNFLAHSAEIRNRIYDFAIAAGIPDTPGGDVLLRKAVPEPYATRLWEFFGFTQTCKQIRAEFRPLWMRSTSIRFMGLETSVSFISTFMPTNAELKHAPGRFTIGTQYMVGENSQCNITRLFRMDAFCPNFYLSFASYEIIMGRPTPDVEGCTCCMDFANPRTGEWNVSTGIKENCTCEPTDADIKIWDEWEGFRDEELPCIYPLCEFEDASVAWWKDLLRNKISIYMAVSTFETFSSFRIVYRERGPKNGSNPPLVGELLDKWGLRALEDYDNVECVVEYKEGQ